MWKFKASKFKNAAPKQLKKEEWIQGVSAANLLNSCGNHIQASNKYLAFNTDSSGGGCLGVLPINASGRYEVGSIPSLQAHSTAVTDFSFSLHDDNLLATAAHDGFVKLWSLPADLPTFMCDASSSITLDDSKAESVSWHPLASNTIAVNTSAALNVYDVENSAKLYSYSDVNDSLLSLDWKSDGSQIVTSCKDKQLRVIDPRQSALAQETKGHPNCRDSRSIFISNRNYVLSTGFGSMREREIVLRDQRNFDSPLKTVAADTASGVLMPFYDEDTGMLFLAGKGDTCIRYYEVTETDIVENSIDSVDQVKGLAMVPKRSMDVMKCEVNRLLLLAKTAIVPLPYCVPRKNYADFHEDLFPCTYNGVPTMTSEEWWGGRDEPGNTISLNPSGSTHKVSTTSQSSGKAVEPIVSKQKKTDEPEPSPVKPSIEIQTPSSQSTKCINSPPKFSKVRSSKFRHLEGTTLHKSLHIDNIRNLSKNMPGESDMFHVNSKFAAIPLGGPGGLIAILKLSNPGRLPDTGVPALQNSSQITDFVFDPFDDHKIVVGCEDAKIRVWMIPEDGLTETLTESDSYLSGHNEKVYFIKYHPLAKDILASASYDMTIRLWDMNTEEEVMQLTGHTDTIFCLSWSMNGALFATSCKDGIIRIYDPRSSRIPIMEGKGPAGSRGARIEWVLDDQYLIVSGFGSTSCRSIFVYDASTLDILQTIELDNSPTILIPFYDEMSSSLFLTSRGDSTIKAFEFSSEPPYLFQLSDYRADSLHQAVSFLPKNKIDVRKVEFALAYRLTPKSIVPLSFTVPRKRSEYFQDDLFPDVKVTWNPTMTSEEWLDGGNIQQQTISLKLADMTSLSDAPPEELKERKFVSYNEYKETYKTDEQKKEELLSAMTSKMDFQDTPLPQDSMEGCDDADWDDY